MAARLEAVKGGKELMAEDGFAVFASRPDQSRGRLYKESPSKPRDDFQRDRDRVIHSTGFRRLKFKTQVFVYHEGDHYRTRLSHSIEVAQVARSLARSLRVNEDLAETCALAHDLGHTPFAHSGEDALKECMKNYGGFAHNDQTLRVVTVLERQYPHFDGLNLTWESLEGLVKHNGPVVVLGKKAEFEITLGWLKDQMDMKLDTFASVEAQIAGLADDIAYNSHDLDDGITAGFFTLKDLADLPLIGEIIHSKKKEFPGVEERRIVGEVIREVMGRYIVDVMEESTKRITALNPKTADDIRHAKTAVIAMSEKHAAYDKAIRSFLWDRFYLHKDVSRMRVKVLKIVKDLFEVFMENKRTLPREWLDQVEAVPAGWDAKLWHARSVADYIASMTDRLALIEHRNIFDAYQDMK